MPSERKLDPSENDLCWNCGHTRSLHQAQSGPCLFCKRVCKSFVLRIMPQALEIMETYDPTKRWF